MKKALLCIAAIIMLGVNVRADMYYSLWGGIGAATKYNQSLATNFGMYQYMGVRSGLAIGLMEMSQKYDLYYAEEQGASMGSTMRMQMSYYYISPMIVCHLMRPGHTHVYVTGGVGFGSGALAEMHKWSAASWTPAGKVYDSFIDQSKSVKQMSMRVGFGFIHYYRLGNSNFHLSINEDVGFTPFPMMDIEDPGNEGLRTNTSQLFRPLVISIRLGISFMPHSWDLKYPHRIRPRRFKGY